MCQTNESVQTRGLIVTVGGQAEQIRFTMTHLQPQYVAFLGTATATCKSQIDALARDFSLPPSSFEQFLFTDSPEKIGEVVQRCFEAVRWLENCGLRREEIALDPTGGRKWMSTAAIIVGTELRLRMLYVHVDMQNGQPLPDTMRLVELGSLYEQINIPRLRDGIRHFNEYDYSGAAEIFRQLHSRDYVWNGLSRNLCQLAELAARIDRFDFNQGGAALAAEIDQLQGEFGRLASTRPELAQLQQLVDDLERFKQIFTQFPERFDKPFRLLVPLCVLAGERRRQRKDWEAAALLYYRTLEMTAQVWLYEDYNGFDTSAPNWELIPENVRNDFLSKNYHAKNKVSLMHSWQLLAALGHNQALAFGRERQNEWRPDFEGNLETRNRMIWAHGFNPANERSVNRLREYAQRAASALYNLSWEEIEQKFSIPCLPALLEEN